MSPEWILENWELGDAGLVRENLAHYITRSELGL